MENIKFTAEDLPVSECSFETGKITMRFKNGKKYVFDKASYLKCVRAQFEYVKNGSISSRDIEKSIATALEKRDMEAEQEDGEKSKPLPKRKIIFRLFENEEAQEDRDFADFSKFDDFCEIVLSMEGEILEDFQYQIIDTLESMAFSQDFISLSRRNPSDWIKAKIPDKTYRYMYFYTNGKTENGYEIWHKAYDPVLWCGMPIKSEKKD